MADKLYRVDVLEKTSHGIYGKELLATWALSETSKKRACCFASEIVAGMTWRELLSESRPDDERLEMRIPWGQGYKLDDMIGHDGAEKYFSYRASIEQ